MCADILDNYTELDELFSLVELDEREEGEILVAVGSSMEEPLREPGLATDGATGKGAPKEALARGRISSIPLLVYVISTNDAGYRE